MGTGRWFQSSASVHDSGFQAPSLRQKLRTFTRRHILIRTCSFCVHAPAKTQVPPFNPDYTMWPSWLEKQNRHYDHLDGPDAFGGEYPEGMEEGSSGEGSLSYEEVSSSIDTATITTSDDDDDVASESYNAWSERAIAEAESAGTLPSTAADVGGTVEEGTGGDVGPATVPAAPTGFGMPLSPDDAAAAMAAAAAAAPATAPEAAFRARAATGLAAAATCRRLKVYCGIDPARGTITLDARELSRWLINRRSYELQAQERPSGAQHGTGDRAGGYSFSCVCGWGELGGASFAVGEREEFVLFPIFLGNAIANVDVASMRCMVSHRKSHTRT